MRGAALLLLFLALAAAGAALVAPHAPQGSNGQGGGSNGGAEPRNILEWVELMAVKEPDGVVATATRTCYVYANWAVNQPVTAAFDVTVRVGFSEATGEPVVRVACTGLTRDPGAAPEPGRRMDPPRWWHGVGPGLVGVYFNASTDQGSWGPFELRASTGTDGRAILVGHARVVATASYSPRPGLGTHAANVTVVVAWSRDWLGAKPPGLVGVAEYTGPGAQGVYYFYVKNDRRPEIQDLWRRAPGLDVPDRDDPDYLVVVYRWDCAARAWVQLGVVEPSYELKWFRYVVEPGCQARVRAEAYEAVGG